VDWTHRFQTYKKDTLKLRIIRTTIIDYKDYFSTLKGIRNVEVERSANLHEISDQTVQIRPFSIQERSRPN